LEVWDFFIGNILIAKKIQKFIKIDEFGELKKKKHDDIDKLQSKDIKILKETKNLIAEIEDDRIKGRSCMAQLVVLTSQREFLSLLRNRTPLLKL